MAFVSLRKMLYHNCFVLSHGTLSCRSCVLGLVVLVKEPRALYFERVGVIPGVSGSYSKHPCLQVSSGLWVTAIKFTYETSYVSLPEIYDNIIITDTRVNRKIATKPSRSSQTLPQWSTLSNAVRRYTLVAPGWYLEFTGNKRPFECNKDTNTQLTQRGTAGVLNDSIDPVLAPLEQALEVLLLLQDGLQL